MGKQGHLRHILEKLRLLGVVVVEGGGGGDVHAARAGQGGPAAGEHMRKKNNRLRLWNKRERAGGLYSMCAWPGSRVFKILAILFGSK
jgi:hypothetical protein